MRGRASLKSMRGHTGESGMSGLVNSGGSGSTPFTDSITFNGTNYILSGTGAGSINAGTGEYTIPATLVGGAVSVVARASGGNGRSDGFAGGGGAYAKKNSYSCAGGEKITIQIGTPTDETGSQVTNTVPTTIVSADSGRNDGSAGVTAVGDITFQGGTGGTSTGQGGGGGGSSAGTTENGRTGGNSNSVVGGAGGTAPAGGFAGGDGGAEGSDGNNGTGYGAGGGGAGNGAGGGAGGVGLVVISGSYVP